MHFLKKPGMVLSYQVSRCWISNLFFFWYVQILPGYGQNRVDVLGAVMNPFHGLFLEDRVPLRSRAVLVMTGESDTGDVTQILEG
jgi:hypothetical protein